MHRIVRKEKRKDRQRRKLEAGVDVGPTRKALKRNVMKNSRCEITVAVDLSFDELMSDKVLSVAFVTFRVTTCLENLELSGNLKHVREMSGMSLTVREMSGKNLVMEKSPKTVHC